MSVHAVYIRPLYDKAFFFIPVNSLTQGPVNVKVSVHALYIPLYDKAFFFTPVNSLTHGPVNVKVLLHALYKPLYILLNRQLQIPKGPPRAFKEASCTLCFQSSGAM